MTLPNANFYYREKLNIIWSPNGRYFAFQVGTSTTDSSYLDQNKFYVVDLEEHSIIDTCLSNVYSPAWSPDNQAFAIFNGQQLLVMNFVSQQLYAVAYVTGYPIGWRADE